MRQEAKGEEEPLGPTTLFYPMPRLSAWRATRPLGPLVSYGERFAREVGRTVDEAALGRRDREN